MGTRVTKTLSQRDPDKLHKHLKNIKIYGDAVDQEFLDETKDGIDTPVMIAVLAGKETIVSGHRRVQAARIHKFKSIDVVIRHDLEDDDIGVRKALIRLNKQREKTPEQVAREHAELLEIAKEEAAARQSASLKKGNKSPVPPPDGGTGNSAEKQGEAAEIVAAEVGVGKTTIKAEAAVIQAIDEAAAKGDEKKADEIRDVLNTRGPNAAAKVVREQQEETEADESKPSKKKPAKDEVVDALKVPVPEKLREVFEEVSWFRSTIKSLGELRSETQELAGRLAGARLDWNDFENHLNQLQDILKHATPHTECPGCKRKPVKTCKTCKGCGFIGKADMKALSDHEKQWLEAR